MARHLISSLALSRGLLFILLAIAPSSILAFDLAPYTNFSPQTTAMLARGDTALVFQALENRLMQSDKDYEAYLDRGWLHLVMDNRKEALNDFRLALGSDSGEVRISAYCGFAWHDFVPGKRRNESLDYVRRALSIDEYSSEALYSRVMLILSGDVAEDDIRTAKGALIKLLETNISYHGIYRFWREEIKDRTDDEIRRVDKSLAEFLETHPDSATWRLELAWDQYLVEGAEAARKQLDRLEMDTPDFSHPDRHLLESCCRLEAGDTLAFQKFYWEAVELARQTGDFDLLISDAATIFTQEDVEKYVVAVDAGAQYEFLHYFWANIDPIKLTNINQRLVEHYIRLAVAKRQYRLSHPHNRFNTSQDANRLLGFQGATIEHKSEVISFSSGSMAGLDHRGLLYMRYGPPDEGRSHLPNENMKIKDGAINAYLNRLGNPMEVWYYGNISFIFEKLPLVGEFISRPLQIAGVEGYMGIHGDVPGTPTIASGDMQTAMTHQIFRKDVIHESSDYYIAQFAAPGLEGLELEIYQDEVLPEKSTPTDAEVAAYDTLWNERDRNSSRFFAIPGEKENRWVAVHTIPFPPGLAKFAIKFEADGETWNGRGSLNLQAFDTDYLELSAVVLGLEPPQDGQSHERRGVRFIPRPSFRFRQGEQMRVYLEYNNLAVDKDRIRNYREYIDVIRYEGEWGSLGRLTGTMVGILSFGEPKEQTQVNFVFDREVEYSEGPVPETFLIDTSDLKPGQYRLLIEARDNVNLFWDNEAVLFEIDG